MPRSVYHLSDVTAAGIQRVEFACSRCDRRGVYRTSTLAERYGADAPLPSVIVGLTADCPLRSSVSMNPWDRCGATCPTLRRVAGLG